MVVKVGEEVNKDWIRWVEYHKELEVVSINGQIYLKINTPCSKLINGLCTVQENKPELCRKFDCGDEEYKDFKFLIQ